MRKSFLVTDPNSGKRVRQQQRREKSDKKKRNVDESEEPVPVCEIQFRNIEVISVAARLIQLYTRESRETDFLSA